ncbi:MAG TPA: D-glycero-beta-D-manno-heptose 1,7-bisphosphate 7-phosphatase [Bacteroidota bacterium]|nr:D-glycero-beta-D-manno-heptose 1,7-bisphosphate 7-phosphatase [Bacteroidota bacterium]
MKVDQVGLFFDRDGTLNTELDFLSRPEELQLIPNAARAIREANDFGLKVFIITNQSGIARGLFTEMDLQAIHKRLRGMLEEQGARVDAIYYCPHHPEYGQTPYKKSCSCRKPKPGMLKKAAKEFGIKLSQSFLIGDRCIDMEAGKAAGCTTALVLTGYGAVEREDCNKAHCTDFVAKDAYEAWLHIKEMLTHKHQSRLHSS